MAYLLSRALLYPVLSELLLCHFLSPYSSQSTSRMFVEAAKSKTKTSSNVNSGCADVLTAPYMAPVVPHGWEAQLIANGLVNPSGLVLDTEGNLLVLESGVGFSRLVFEDTGGDGCLALASGGLTSLVTGSSLNHNIQISNDGQTVYASDSGQVYSWAYNATSATVSQTHKTLVDGMSDGPYDPRTILVPPNQDNVLVVGRGGDGNIDPLAEVSANGHGEIKVFNLNNTNGTATTVLNWTTHGSLVASGLRRPVGIALHPISGGYYSLDETSTNLTRSGVSIKLNDPGEELNFLGVLTAPLNTTPVTTPSNFGYPDCFAIWGNEIPKPGMLTIGDQFAPDNSTATDTTCNDATMYTGPRLTFQAHAQPADMKFISDGTVAWVAFKGSVYHSPPVGYKVSQLSFSATTGSPTDPKTATNAAIDIFSNADITKCPVNCFRPTALAVDSKDRVYVATEGGEIYLLVNTAANGTYLGTPGPEVKISAARGKVMEAGRALRDVLGPLGVGLLMLGLVASL